MTLGYNYSNELRVRSIVLPSPIISTSDNGKAQWEADKCSKHFGYRLKGKAGSNRPIPMARAKSLATRFYQLKCGHAPTGVYLKRFGHREDDKC